MSELRLVVDIPFAPPKAASPNSRGGWWGRHKAAKEAREAAYLAAMVPNRMDWIVTDGRIAVMSPDLWTASVEWTIYLPKGAHRADADNMIARCKGFLDGIFQALCLDDKMVEEIKVKQERDPEGRGRTVAVVTARKKE